MLNDLCFQHFCWNSLHRGFPSTLCGELSSIYGFEIHPEFCWWTQNKLKLRCNTVRQACFPWIRASASAKLIHMRNAKTVLDNFLSSSISCIVAPGGIAIVLLYKLFASCLEVINWSDYFLNIYGIADIVQDSLDGFIRHRALIQSIAAYRSREDAIHLLLKL